MKRPFLLILLVLGLSSCNTNKRFTDLDRFNLKGKVKSVEEKRYRINKTTETLTFDTEFSTITRLDYSSLFFQEQDPNYEGGALGHNTKRTFNKKGHLICLQNDYDNKEHPRQAFYYELFWDGENRLVKKIERDGDKEIVKETSYEFDEKNAKYVFKNTHRTDTLIYLPAYIKNNVNNRRIEIRDGYLQYDKIGNLIEKKAVNAFYYYKYDEEQRLISSLDKERVGATEYSEYSKEHFYEGGIIQATDYYFKNWIDEKPKLIKKKTFRYDELGNMIELAEDNFNGGYNLKHELKIMKFDAKDNWIKAAYYINEKLTFILMRSVEYY